MLPRAEEISVGWLKSSLPRNSLPPSRMLLYHTGAAPGCGGDIFISIIAKMCCIGWGPFTLVKSEGVCYSVRSDSLWPHGLRMPGFPISWSLLRPCPLSCWCYLTVLSSPAPFSFCLTRDQTWTPALEAQNLNHWTTRDVPCQSF